MDLTNNKLLAALSAVILTGLIALSAYFVSRPYIQYEEGRVYKTGVVSVVSVRLENKGYFDAEQVSVEASFPEPILEITSGDAISPYSVTTGGNGFKTVGGSIPRISPSQATYVYFAVDNSSGVIGENIPGFVRQVTFKNGKGFDQPPMWVEIVTSLFFAGLGALITALVIHFFNKYKDTSREADHLRNMNSQLTEQYTRLVKLTEEFIAFVPGKAFPPTALPPVDKSDKPNKTGS